MMAKDSVKNRLSGENVDGMSFTEFTYQMVQGYDFLHLYKNHDCTLQMGGSDQWGNITTGTELIRRIASGKGYALTCPLITKSVGSKFGKSEGGNVWLDSKRTSPYKFYQYWLNTSDQDAAKYIKIFTFLDKQTIDGLISQHQGQEHAKGLQKRLAQEVTTTVHGAAACSKAMEASTILFSKTAAQDINNIDEDTFLSIFEGVPIANIAKSELVTGLDIIAALAEKTGFLKSNGEARRALKENSISVNKTKVGDTFKVTDEDLINDRYVLLQRGKKSYYILNFV
jgi:tyrosyl-tRNA synthetase